MAGRQVAFGVFMVLLSLCASSHAETDTDGNQEDKSVTIPLDQIWAYRMPGTRNVEKMGGKLVLEIRRSLGFPLEKKEAKAAFIVLGTGKDSLLEAHSVFTEKNKPRKTFPAGGDVSAVFFSAESNRYVHLHRVERQGNVVNIRYRFVPHECEETTRHLALIPLGKLPPGEYRVNVIQSPMEQKYVEHSFPSISEAVARRVVCNSFSFSIGEQGE